MLGNPVEANSTRLEHALKLPDFKHMPETMAAALKIDFNGVSSLVAEPLVCPNFQRVGHRGTWGTWGT